MLVLIRSRGPVRFPMPWFECEPFLFALSNCSPFLSPGLNVVRLHCPGLHFPLDLSESTFVLLHSLNKGPNGELKQIIRATRKHSNGELK